MRIFVLAVTIGPSCVYTEGTLLVLDLNCILFGIFFSNHVEYLRSDFCF